MESQPPIKIRRMQIEDVPQVAQIDQISFTLPWPERSFRYEITQNQASRHWVAETLDESEPRVVAMLVCWLILDEAHVGTIAVHPDFRRQKIAERLMRQALEELSAEGVRVVFLEVRRSNEAARTLYKNFGFREDGVRKRYYKDNHEDAIMMVMDDWGSLNDKERSNGPV